MGKLDNTLILFASDNGPTDWPHYYKESAYPETYDGEMYPPGFTGGLAGRKWSLYEGGIREPFIVYWKGHVPEGKVDRETVISAMDIYPSICSVLGIGIPENIDGTDKSQAFKGSPVKDVPPLMWEYASNPGGSILPGNPQNISPNLAIRDGDWKLLINADGTEGELYNLEKDPEEKNDLYEQRPEKVYQLKENIMEWRKSMPVDIPQ